MGVVPSSLPDQMSPSRTTHAGVPRTRPHSAIPGLRSQIHARYAPRLLHPTVSPLRRTVSAGQESSRPLWLGPYRDVPPYLDGSLVGDYGWDTSGLSSTPDALLSNRNLELIHDGPCSAPSGASSQNSSPPSPTFHYRN